MKKILSLFGLLGVCLALSLTACGKTTPPPEIEKPTPPEIEEPDTGLTFAPVTEGEQTVAYSVKDIGTFTGKDLAIPSKYNGLPVTGIEEDAFANDGTISAVVIPDSVTTVGANAFYNCTGLESVTVGSSVAQIGASAFSKCGNIKSVHVNSVADWCAISFASTGSNPMYFASRFYENGKLVEDLVIPDSVTAIPDFAFYTCENITSVTVGKGVTAIGQSAFYGCENLESVRIGGKVVAMGELAFAECYSLATLEIENTVEIIGDYAFMLCTSLEEVTVPASVKTIGECAFIECEQLKSIKLNEGLLNIGDGAFSDCISLEEFDMPSSVTSIGYGILMFGGSYGFGGVNDSYNCVKRVSLSPELTEITDFAFSYCGINTIELGDKVTIINYSAFYGCGQLESIVIPKSLTKIVSYAFYKCAMLNTIYYKGTAEEWSKVTVGKSGNDNLTGANDAPIADVYCYSEEQPAKAGNFWHYVDGVPTKW